MGLLDRIANAFSGKTTNSIANGNDFLKNGPRSTLTPTWSNVSMDKQDSYKGYAYAAIQKRANKVAKLARENLKTWANDSTVTKASEINLVIMHPYLRVIESSTKFSEKKFWKDISIYLDLVGRYYLGVVRGRIENEKGEVTYGDVKDFILLNPYEITRVINSAGEVAGYVERKPDGRTREWAVHQIIEMRELNPMNQDSNFSMVDAAKESLYTINQATDYARQTLNGNLNSPGIITTDVILEDEDFANFRSRVLNSEKGTPLFGNGTGAINWQSMQVNLDQAALTNIKSGSRDEFFAVSGTSKTVLGIEESGTTRETARTQTELFLSDVAEPRLEDIIDFLNLDFKEKYPDLYSKYGYLIEVTSSTSRDYDTYIKAVQLKRDEYQLAQDIIDAGYERETAIKYAKGEIELDQIEEVDFTALMEEQRQQEQSEPQIPEETPEEQPPTETPEEPTEETTEENALVETEDGELSFAEPDGWIGGVLKPINIAERLTAANKLNALSQTSDDYSATPAETNPHFTFFYGLESNPIEMKEIIAPIVEKVKEVTVKEISHFDLEENYAVVALLEKTPEILKARKLLEKLPHGEQKFDYNPHITLAYIKKEENPEDFYSLFEDLPGQIFDVLAIDYGDGYENGLYSEPIEEEEHNHSDGRICEHCSHNHEENKIETYYNDLSQDDAKLLEETYNDFLKKIQTVQADTIRQASKKVTVNSFEESDIITEEQKETLTSRLIEIIKDYWWILTPVFANALYGQRNTQFKTSESFFFDDELKKKISENAEKVASGHAQTILNNILKASNKAYKGILEGIAVNLIKDLYGRNPEKLADYFQEEPTEDAIKQAIAKTDILEQNKKIYEKANKLVREGYSRNEIVKAIREEYKNLSEKRAKAIAQNETSRAFTQIQFEADKRFLNSTGKMASAYKELYSRSGNPCPFCKEVIDKGPIPFEQPFVELGETLKTTVNGKESQWTADYETINAGVMHTNCQCQYRLILKDSSGEVITTFNSLKGENTNHFLNKISNTVKEHPNG